jgi:hypothetical protein
MKEKINITKWFVVLILLVSSTEAHAGVFEFSFGFGFNKSQYNDSDYVFSRRWMTSLGYHFTETSGIEVAFQTVVTRTKIAGLQDTTFEDQVYSANWIQSFTHNKAVVQPYIKLGIGQLNRDATGSYANGGSPNLQVDELTGVFGIGCKIYLFGNTAFRTEATTYLVGGSLNTWQDNVAISFGVSLYF